MNKEKRPELQAGKIGHDRGARGDKRVQGGYNSVKNHFVYILKCADGTLYTGYTTKPAKRLRMHKLGMASKFTRSRLPVKLVHLEGSITKSAALRRELEIKSLSRSEKLRLCDKR